MWGNNIKTQSQKENYAILYLHGEVLGQVLHDQQRIVALDGRDLVGGLQAELLELPRLKRLNLFRLLEDLAPVPVEERFQVGVALSE